MPEKKPISVNVRLLTEELFVEITVVECLYCFCLVREDKLDEHARRLHS
jgi:hypothetical protein